MPRVGESTDDSVLRVPNVSSFFNSAIRRGSDTWATSVTMRGSRSGTGCAGASRPTLQTHSASAATRASQCLILRWSR